MAERTMLNTTPRAQVANLPDTIVTLFRTASIVVAEGAQLQAAGSSRAYAGVPRETMPADQFSKPLRATEAALAGEPQAFDVDTPDGQVTYRVQVGAP